MCRPGREQQSLASRRGFVFCYCSRSSNRSRERKPCRTALQRLSRRPVAPSVIGKLIHCQELALRDAAGGRRAYAVTLAGRSGKRASRASPAFGAAVASPPEMAPQWFEKMDFGRVNGCAPEVPDPKIWPSLGPLPQAEGGPRAGAAVALRRDEGTDFGAYRLETTRARTRLHGAPAEARRPHPALRATFSRKREKGSPRLTGSTGCGCAAPDRPASPTFCR
jgi:hypothetical protein